MDCKEAFELPTRIDGDSSEYSGRPVTEDRYVCPICGSEDYVEADEIINKFDNLLDGYNIDLDCLIDLYDNEPEETMLKRFANCADEIGELRKQGVYIYESEKQIELGSKMFLKLFPKYEFKERYTSPITDIVYDIIQAKAYGYTFLTRKKKEEI